MFQRLRPTRARLQRLVNQALHGDPDFQAQSVTTTPHAHKQWACPVYHDDTGVKQSIDALLKGIDSIQWNKSLTNELGRLAQGIGKNRPSIERIEGTNTIIFVKKI